MNKLWKILLVLGLVLPLGVFVAGSLASSSADEPAPRETIVIDDSGSTTGPAGPGATGSPSPSSTPTSGGGEPGDDHGVEVVSPSPDDIGDDHGGDSSGRGGGGGDDNNRSGSGRDDHSGHGSGHR
ncbi:MAG: hypothetical protein JWO11_1817 [Nocardioides sp.]|nr:hypothetical protein [Nocardioides sp.]